jgi:hypothetical protein
MTIVFSVVPIVVFRALPLPPGSDPSIRYSPPRQYKYCFNHPCPSPLTLIQLKAAHSPIFMQFHASYRAWTSTSPPGNPAQDPGSYLGYLAGP